MYYVRSRETMYSEIADLLNKVFLQELACRLSEVGNYTCIDSLLVSIPAFRCNAEAKNIAENTNIRAQLDMITYNFTLNRLTLGYTLPYYITQYDETRLKKELKRAFNQIYYKLLDIPLHCLVIETPPIDKLSIEWYINHASTDVDKDKDTHLAFKIIYGLGAVIYTPMNALKKFPGNRLKLITDVTRNKGHAYTSMTIKEINQLHDNVYTSNR